MLKNRIIPCLDVDNGRTVKGTNFVNLKDSGDPVELSMQYEKDGADELVLLDITATVNKQKQSLDLVDRIAKNLRIPFSIGGGISSLDDISNLMQNGADKIAMNSFAVHEPSIIDSAAKRFGSQAIVIAIDIKKEKNGDYYVYVHGGRTKSNKEAYSWIREVANRGAGELLITSMDHDGVRTGFNLEFYKNLQVNVPIIASGGAGNASHFADLFTQTKVNGGLAAGIFHDKILSITDLKNDLKGQDIAIR